MMIFFLIGE